MPFQTRYLFTASMDVEAEKEALFEEIYDTDHIPLLTKVPGIVSVARFKREDRTWIMGGERMTISVEDEPQYSALYEIESPDVLVSDAWAKAVDQGRWPSEVRPYTSNRRHTLRRLVFSAP